MVVHQSTGRVQLLHLWFLLFGFCIVARQINKSVYTINYMLIYFIFVILQPSLEPESVCFVDTYAIVIICDYYMLHAIRKNKTLSDTAGVTA